MTAVAPTPVFGAIEQQLKTLCLQEFPCGPGSWRESEISSPGKKSRMGQKKPALVPVINIKYKDKSATNLEAVKLLAQKEKSEALQELVSSHFSPWHLDYSWSEEAKELREIAVKSPWLIDKNFVLNYFKTLRIIDKEITEVDRKLLKLKNLEELTLSANFITNVNSKNLPASLKVLELCANRISDVSSLCVRPPLLNHLGLGRNRISFIGDYLTGDYWPNLLSLDLSHNDLCDLMDIIRKMTTLPKLRNLILQGNPLSLIPSYRGYTIDCLRRLTVMDDIHISADEKHHFKGLARRRVQLGVSYIKGLPCPEEVKHPENQPEFPVVERTYFIQFMFPEETGLKAEEVHMDVAMADDMADMTTIAGEGAGTERQEEEGGETTRRDSDPEHKSVKDKEQQQQPPASPTTIAAGAANQAERNVLFDSRPQLKSAAPPASSVQSFPQAKPSSEDPEVKPGPEVEGINLDLLTDNQQGEGEDGGPSNRTEEPTPRIKLVPVNSDPKPWSEELQLDWSVDLVRDDLLTLRDFFKQGMDFTVVEQVVLGYPAEPDTATTDDKEKDGKDKKKDKGGKEPAKAEKGGKKKKEPEIELIKSPPTYTTIAAFHITLEPFLEGEFFYQNIFTKGDVPPPSTVRSSMTEERREKRDSKKKLDKSPEKGDKKKDAKKSPRGKDEGSKKGSKGGRHAEEAEEDDLPPPPLELEVSVKLHHWVTAMDSVREEEERAAKALAAGSGGSLVGSKVMGSKDSLNKLKH
ncbi:leucine-rich repeat-containing protein 43 [Plakobranchus ocellatus]|uniref:Leucine-rich repeat-containing protein 43 n=1 Tax=Plakobranchus ocellatus TaxID=259542 RepID=A0AAV4D0N8_9GAST|nr:leucine-rich repeat-containing protein 43 [Plakobranchus ocellatus]